MFSLIRSAWCLESGKHNSGDRYWFLVMACLRRHRLSLQLSVDLHKTLTLPFQRVHPPHPRYQPRLDLLLNLYLCRRYSTLQLL